DIQISHIFHPISLTSSYGISPSMKSICSPTKSRPEFLLSLGIVSVVSSGSSFRSTGSSLLFTGNDLVKVGIIDRASSELSMELAYAAASLL
ncbi:hypothetical protein PENTCL1PPCAC_19149, partial [Pristionchus entomophagus]